MLTLKRACKGNLRVGVAQNGRETGVARYRKLGGSLEESARGAQRGLLVILGSALLWLVAIWIGYRLFS